MKTNPIRKIEETDPFYDSVRHSVAQRNKVTPRFEPQAKNEPARRSQGRNSVPPSPVGLPQMN